MQGYSTLLGYAADLRGVWLGLLNNKYAGRRQPEDHIRVPGIRASHACQQTGDTAGRGDEHAEHVDSGGEADYRWDRLGGSRLLRGAFTSGLLGGMRTHPHRSDGLGLALPVRLTVPRIEPPRAYRRTDGNVKHS
jgi:hypothetical protein